MSQPSKREHEKIPGLSRWSSPAVPNSGWCSSNLMLGSGMILIQRSTHKIVVVRDTAAKDSWFFPRGRKDLGETLEEAALREAYEESGYRAEFMPVYNPSRAPAPPGKEALYSEPNTEPVYLTTSAWKEKRQRYLQGPDPNLGYQYLTSWYIGQIADDAVPDKGTGMKDEQSFVGYLMSYEDAMRRLWDGERAVLAYAWAVYCNTLQIEQEKVQQEQGEGRVKNNAEGSGFLEMAHGGELGVCESSFVKPVALR